MSRLSPSEQRGRGGQLTCTVPGCGAASVLKCDAVAAVGAQRGVCGARVCSEHARPIGQGLHVCPRHPAAGAGS